MDRKELFDALVFSAKRKTATASGRGRFWEERNHRGVKMSLVFSIVFVSMKHVKTKPKQQGNNIDAFVKKMFDRWYSPIFGSTMPIKGS